MRIRRDSYARLDPADVAWVAEWQLAAALPWVPRPAEGAVVAAEGPEPEGHYWEVRLRIGPRSLAARLPLRDLAKVVAWCRTQRDRRALEMPPTPIRASLRALRVALAAAAASEDPLDWMGYRRSE